MIAFAYLVPAVACLALHFLLGYEGKWTSYLIILGTGELTVGLLHYLFMRRLTYATEYLGSIITSIHYEEPWTELVRRTRTYTDKNGKTHTTTYIEHRYHPEQHYFFTTTGSRFDTDDEYFAEVRSIWSVEPRFDQWRGSQIRGGVRYGHHYSFEDLPIPQTENPNNWIPVTETHRYKNKIHNSNSIFRFQEIGEHLKEKYGLFDYPHITGYDAPCILSRFHTVPTSADVMFRRFNGRFAPEAQMRLYILLFDAALGPGTSEIQRAYWHGGNKNEFTMCLGLDEAGKIVWARTFSWADEQTLERETDMWLMQHPVLDWESFYNWLRLNIHRWNRKQFKDFDYLYVALPLRYFLIILFLTIAESVVAICIALS